MDVGWLLAGRCCRSRSGTRMSWWPRIRSRWCLWPSASRRWSGRWRWWSWACSRYGRAGCAPAVRGRRGSLAAALSTSSGAARRPESGNRLRCQAETEDPWMHGRPAFIVYTLYFGLGSVCAPSTGTSSFSFSWLSQASMDRFNSCGALSPWGLLCGAPMRSGSGSGSDGLGLLPTAGPSQPGRARSYSEDSSPESRPPAAVSLKRFCSLVQPNLRA